MNFYKYILCFSLLLLTSTLEATSTSKFKPQVTEEEKDDTVKSTQNIPVTTLALPTKPIKIKQIGEVSVEDNSIFYPTPDIDWHRKSRDLVTNTYEKIENLFNKESSYSVATFEIRTIVEKENKEITEDKKLFNSILFLSKMDLRLLVGRINSNIIDENNYVRNTKDIINYLKLNNVLDIICVGDFFKNSHVPEHEFKRYLSDLFDFKERYVSNSRDVDVEGIKSNLRNDLATTFVRNLPDEVKRRTYNSKDSKTWQGFQDELKTHYTNSLLGILPFDKQSNAIASRYFQGNTADYAFLFFNRSFADSEQAIYQFLLCSNNLRLSPVPEKGKLKYIIVDMISYRPICKFCEGTALRYIETKQISNRIKSYLKIKDKNDIPVSFFSSYVKSVKEES